MPTKRKDFFDTITLKKPFLLAKIPQYVFNQIFSPLMKSKEEIKCHDNFFLEFVFCEIFSRIFHIKIFVINLIYSVFIN